MVTFYKDKKMCIDVFNAYMAQDAEYDREFEIPKVHLQTEKPNKLTCFSKINQVTDYNSWVHFYEHDYIIERIWRNPYRYLDILKKFNGVILPDFSLYRDMPLIYQYYNIYRSRAMGNWFYNNHIKYIVNLRLGDYRTFHVGCSGIPLGSCIAMGSHGTMKHKSDRIIFEAGVEYAIIHLHPSMLIIYGTVSDTIVRLCHDNNIELVVFPSDFALSHKHLSEVN